MCTFCSPVRRYCEGRQAQLEKRRGALLAEEQARCGCGQDAQRVSSLRQFLVGPVLHQVSETLNPKGVYFITQPLGALRQFSVGPSCTRRFEP